MVQWVLKCNYKMIRISTSSVHDEVSDKELLFTDMNYQSNCEQAVIWFNDKLIDSAY